MDSVKVDVIIPTFHPKARFLALMEQLEKQVLSVNRIVIVNTEKKAFEALMDCDTFLKKHPKAMLFHISQDEFDHGKTRNLAVSNSDAEVFVCMTQDALPADEYLTQELCKALFSDEKIAAAYARQLPEENCSRMERYTRRFNYPEQPSVKTKADLSRLGIKTYFCSNVCAAYKRDIFKQLGGFVNHTIFNEDMIYAAGAIQAGYAIAYAADAKVIHSHNYSGWQQFTRNFDLGVSHVQYPAVFDGVPPEGEGMKLVKKTAVYLVKTAPWLLPKLIWQSGMKWLGYRFGKKYQKLPPELVRFCSLQKGYWKQEKE